MAPTIIILVGVAIVVAAWLRGPTGLRAIRACGARPRVFAPAAMLFAFDAIVTVLPKTFANPIVKLAIAGLSFAWSVESLALFGAQVVAVAWLMRELAFAFGEKPAVDMKKLARRAFAALAVAWVAIFATLAVVMALMPQMNGLVVLIGWAVGLLAMNAWLAPFWVALPVVEDARAILGEASALRRADAWRWRRAVIVHALVVGLVTFVWLDGYLIIHPNDTFTSLHTTSFKVHGECALNLTLASNWPGDVAEATKSDVPEALAWVLKLAGIVWATIFAAGYAAIGYDARAKSREPAAP